MEWAGPRHNTAQHEKSTVWCVYEKINCESTDWHEHGIVCLGWARAEFFRKSMIRHGITQYTR